MKSWKKFTATLSALAIGMSLVTVPVMADGEENPKLSYEDVTMSAFLGTIAKNETSDGIQNKISVTGTYTGTDTTKYSLTFDGDTETTARIGSNGGNNRAVYIDISGKDVNTVTVKNVQTGAILGLTNELPDGSENAYVLDYAQRVNSITANNYNPNKLEITRTSEAYGDTNKVNYTLAGEAINGYDYIVIHCNNGTVDVGEIELSYDLAIAPTPTPTATPEPVISDEYVSGADTTWKIHEVKGNGTAVTENDSLTGASITLTSVSEDDANDIIQVRPIISNVVLEKDTEYTLMVDYSYDITSYNTDKANSPVVYATARSMYKDENNKEQADKTTGAVSALNAQGEKMQDEGTIKKAFTPSVDNAYPEVQLYLRHSKGTVTYTNVRVIKTANVPTPTPVPTVSATNVTINSGFEKTLYKNETIALSASVEPANSTDELSWSFTDSNGEDCSSQFTLKDGVLTYLFAGNRRPGNGTVTVTATAGEVSDTTEIKVERSRHMSYNITYTGEDAPEVSVIGTVDGVEKYNEAVVFNAEQHTANSYSGHSDFSLSFTVPEGYELTLSSKMANVIDGTTITSDGDIDNDFVVTGTLKKLVKAENVEISTNYSKTLYRNDSIELGVTVEPQDATDAVEWTIVGADGENYYPEKYKNQTWFEIKDGYLTYKNAGRAGGPTGMVTVRATVGEVYDEIEIKTQRLAHFSSNITNETDLENITITGATVNGEDVLSAFKQTVIDKFVFEGADALNLTSNSYGGHSMYTMTLAIPEGYTIEFPEREHFVYEYSKDRRSVTIYNTDDIENDFNLNGTVVYENTEPEIVYAAAEDAVTSIGIKNFTGEATVYVAQYNENGTLASVSVVNVENSDMATVNIPISAKSAKAMAWNGMQAVADKVIIK
ncbi:MAG: hypothetical protein IJT23_04655 [Clostridia bacterium]|nr:hypothetical protein [Clostridia bacterium]